MKTLYYIALYGLFALGLLGAGGSQAATVMKVASSEQASFRKDSPETSTMHPAQSEDSTVNLRVTVRDFTTSHPDFETETTYAHRPGLVNSTLGIDRKPVFAGPDGNGGNISSETFNQWYNDVPGVNQSIELLLLLTETSPGSQIFTYKNNAFFPIDRQLFGNQGLPHNFHFTLELHTTFVYQGGEVLSVNGDDDIWVFINDQLAVDLGGVHSELSASVELDTLGLTVGESYPLDLFFAERHTGESHFGLTTSIVAETGPTYTISGQVTDANSAPLSGVIVSIGQGLSTATGSDGSYAVSGIPNGSYTVIANKSGYTFSPDSYLVSIPPDVTGLDFAGSITTSTPLSIEVLAKTAEDHFLDAPLECHRASANSPLRCASTASVPLEVNVREASTKSPVQAQITLLPDETKIGITSPSGLLSSQIPITEPAVVEEKVVAVSADVNDEPVSSGSLILYRAESVIKSNAIILTQDEADAYGRLFPQNYVRNSELNNLLCDALLEESCVQSLAAWLITELGGSNYAPMAGDVIGEEVFRYTDPNGNVENAYALVQQIQRQDDVIATQTVWSENSDNFTSRQIARRALVIEVGSPVVLFVANPQGQGAGFDPTTQQIQFDFPVAISDTGDEPYTLVFPSPNAGQYELQIIGVDSGFFTLDVYELDQNGQATSSQRVSKNIDAGVVITCELDYDPAQEQQLFTTVLVTCPTPALTVTKSMSTAQASVGDTITYTYRITNTGNVSLTINANDNRLGTVAGLAGQLLPNVSPSATLTYVVQPSDLPGPLVNTVVVTGTDTFGTIITDSASASVTTLPAEEQPPQILLPQVER